MSIRTMIEDENTLLRARIVHLEASIAALEAKLVEQTAKSEVELAPRKGKK